MKEKMVLDSAETDMLFGIEALEIKAKIDLANMEMTYYQQREELLSRVTSAARTKKAAFDAAVRARGLDPSEFKVDIGTGMIVAGDSPVDLLKLAGAKPKRDDKNDVGRGMAVTVRMKDDDTDR